RGDPARRGRCVECPRDRRPPRGDPERDCCARFRRRAVDCGQGTRDGADRRCDDLAVLGSRRGRGGAPGECSMSGPLWTVEAMAEAMGAQKQGALPAAVSGLSIDTRTIVLGEAFFAIKGDARDGHEFVDAALKAGAGLAVVSASRRDTFPKNAPLLIVPD